jgi:DNA-binding XRE family transcriptional regulator
MAHAGGRPTAFKKEYRDQAIKLCKLGATNADLADFFGVTTQTICNWKKNNQEFFDAIKTAKQIADDKVQASLYRLATGFEYKAQKPMVVNQGMGEGSEIQLAEYTEMVTPNPTAIIFWLKNRRPAEWRDRQEVEHSGSIATPSFNLLLQKDDGHNPTT